MSKTKSLDKNLLLKLHKLMVKARVTEERLIHIYKQGLGYFWIGGPGEEAFSVPLGLLINKGQGLNHDWLHLHYRCLPTLIGMGLSMKQAFRTMFNKATDSSSGGRNFANHYSLPEWNVTPVSSVIENQYSMAIGTAHVLKRTKNNKSVSIVTGGDAGTHEGDFATCLIWASRPKQELPLLITVQNNSWGISTHYDTQHGEASPAKRGDAFNIPNVTINGNDPVESYLILKEKLAWIRKHRRPCIIEARVSRLYGHSSASGANRTKDACPIDMFEKDLLKQGVLTKQVRDSIWLEFQEEAKQVQKEVAQESEPKGESIWDHVYMDNEEANWRKF